MAELDRFEARFVAAYRRYLAEAPVEVDAVAVARQVAAAAPRRHALAGFRPFGLSPALAWTVLLAALLAALVGGALLVGSQPQRRLPAVVPPVGQVFECPPGSTPDEPGPVDQARPPCGGSTMAFDRRAGRLVARHGRRATASRRGRSTCARTPGPGCTRTGNRRASYFGTLVYDVDSDVTIASDVRGPGVGLRPRGQHLDGEGHRSGRRTRVRALVLRPGLGPRRRPGDDGLDTLGRSCGATRSRPTRGPRSPGEAAGHRTPLRVLRLRRLRRPAGRVRQVLPDCEDVANPPQPIWAMTWLFDLRTGTWSGTSAVTPEFFCGGWFTDVPRSPTTRRRSGP